MTEWLLAADLAALPLSTATEVHSWRPFLAVLASGLAVFLILASARHPTVREGWSILAAVVKFGLVASMIPDVMAGLRPTSHLWTLAPGVELAFRADPLGMVFALVASGLYIVTAVYSIGYLRTDDARNQPRFFAALAASLSATIGVAFATNLLVLLFFYELLTVATYPLVTHIETREARRAGYKYLVYAFSGGAIVFFGTIVVLWAADSVTFAAGGIDALADADRLVARIGFAALVVGFGVKAAVMPLHSWLPSAMIAPTPVSGLLHAVAVVKAGVFGIARTVLDVFGPSLSDALGLSTVLAIVAGATILLASLIALRQDNLKRLLAYSTIAQLSYIVLGVALLSPAAIGGAVLHLPAHAFAKLTLFFCAGALHVELHVDAVSEATGVGSRMPLTMGAFAIGSASMVGIPLFAGFISKWHLLYGGFQTELLVVVALLIVSGALNVAYFWPVVFAAFFERPDTGEQKPIVTAPFGGSDTGPGHDPFDRPDGMFGETTPYMLGPIIATGALVLIFGLVPWATGFFDLAGLVVELSTGVNPS